MIRHALGQAPQGSLVNLASSLPATPTLHSGLNASFNWLSDIPASLPERLPHLVTLNLSHNRLATINDVILLALPHLCDISLSNNLLQALPESIHLLPKLTRLDCSHNVIEVLPSALGLCPALRALDCSHNRLKQLPISLGKSQTLQLLLATGNPCTSPPKDVCEKGSGETLSYLRAIAHGLDPNSATSGPNVEEGSRPRKLVFPRAHGSALGMPVGHVGSGGSGVGAKEQYVELQQGGRQVAMQTAVGLRTPLFPPPGSSTLDALELRDRVAGLLFGAVVGDSIGLATEFLSRDECMFHYCPLGKTTSTDGSATVLPLLQHDQIIRDGHRVRWSRGDWTSHSEIMLLVLDSVIHWGGVVDELDFAARLKTWSDTLASGEAGEVKKEAGTTTGVKKASEGKSHISSPIIRKVLSKANFSSFPHDAAHAVWKEAVQFTASKKLASEESTYLDNGSLPQSIVLGVPHFYNLNEVLSNSSRICLTSHQDPACVAASVATSVIIAELLQGRLGGGVKGEVDGGSALDGVFRSARDAAWPHLKDCSSKVQSAFDACFWPHTRAELETLVIEEVHHPFTTLSVAAQALRDDCEGILSTTVPPPLSSPSHHQPWCTAAKVAAGDACWFPVAECSCNGGEWGGGEGAGAKCGVKTSPSAYEHGVSRVAQLCGHASANCCLSGALLGCAHGYSSLPSRWVEQGLDPAKRTLLTARINALLNLMALP
ncbi:uncharacterized protein LOC124155630 isoform X2 [Ischnura elegans]|uniref:uncharacterized protein LOC124155630 isoform X2 n=1 Tax=Ischnura elegans TaxID=197161 RepID=UPI001ED8B279|nr:uncharacterized protein LOC124155630 isoform X2 [Ischnura elegans]